MRSYLLACVLGLTACGGSSTNGGKVDAPPGGGSDGSGGGTDSGGGGGDGSGATPTTVNVTLTNRPNNPGNFSFIAAYQDGAGAWQLAPAPSGDTYSFTVSSPVWSFAWTCIVPNTNLARVELASFTVAERSSLTSSIPAACTDRFGTPVGLSGTVNNLVQISNGGYAASYATRTRNVQGGGGFALEAPAGPHDLFITAGSFTGGTGGGGGATASAVARTTATAPSTTADVDWSTSKPVQTASVTGAPNGAFVTTTLYSTTTQVTLAFESGGPYTVIGLDSSQAQAGDVYAEAVTTRSNGSTTVAESWVSSVGALAYTAPASLSGSTSNVTSTTPYPIIATSWSQYANATGYVWDARQGGGGGPGNTPTLEWTAVLGPGYVGTMPKFQMPDLSGLSGWSSGFELQTGVQVFGSASASTSSAGTADFPPATPAAAGTTRVLASSGWTVTP